MQKTAVVLQTHFINQAILAMLARLQNEAGAGRDVFLALNLTTSELAAPDAGRALGERLFLCNHESLLQLGYPGKCKPGGWSGKGWSSVDNVDTIMLAFYREHRGYDYYWCVEYDVHYEGHWSFLFDRFRASTADLLATMLDTAAKVPWKIHMPPFVSPDGKAIDYKDAVVGFFPINRASNRFLSVLDADYMKGWNGHHELTWGTTAKRHGLEIEDIGGQGPYTKPHNVNTFYFNTIERWDLSPGTFVYRPAFTEIPHRENTLWHPVKPPGEYFNHAAALREHGLSNWLRYIFKRMVSAIAIRLWFRLRWRPASSSDV